jgi:two-component sensor histidine kinase
MRSGGPAASARSAAIGAEAYARAMLNILEDSAAEKELLREAQTAMLNVLEDLAIEKARLVQTQKELVRSEEAARSSLHEKEALLKEIHHRVKNNLQAISSLLNLQARYLPDPAARKIFTQSQCRVQSIALVHEQLYRSVDLAHVDFHQYVESLVDNLFHTHDAGDRGIAREVDVGGVQLPIDLAIPCGLLVNELVTNSFKHGFPGGRRGTIRVSLREEQPGSLHLMVADDGVGIPPDLDLRSTRSLGLDLIFTFVNQLHATLEVKREGGTTFELRFRREA